MKSVTENMVTNSDELTPSPIPLEGATQYAPNNNPMNIDTINTIK